MTQKVGGVEFEVNVDADGAIFANQKIVNSNENVEDSFDRIDNATRKTGRAFETVGRTGKKSASNLDKSLGQVGRKAGMASIQIQQLVGQVQGGVNPFTALSQQGADLGIVLGAPLIGSVVGISAALATYLMPSVFESKTALEKLEETTEKLKETMEIGANGTALYSESLRKLAQRSESLAKVKIAIGIADANKQIKIAVDEIKDNIDGLSQGTFKRFNDNLANSGKTVEEFASAPIKLSTSFGNLTANIVGPMDAAIKGLQRKFGVTRVQAVDLAQALSMFANNKNALGVGALESALEGLNSETGFTNDKLLKFTDIIIPLLEAVKNGTDVTNEFKLALNNLDDALGAESGVESFNKMTAIATDLNQKLAISAVELGYGENAARRLALAFELGLTNAEDLPDEIRQSIAAIEEVEARKLQQIETEKQARADAAAQLREEESQQQERESNVEKLRLEAQTEREIMAEKFLAEQQLLEESLNNKEITQQEFEALRESNAQNHANKILEIQENKAKAEKAIEELSARTRLNQTKNALGNVASLMNTESRKLFEIGKAAALANAVVTGYDAAVTNYKKGSEIGGPPLGAAFAAASIAATFAQIKQIQATQFGSAGTGQSIQGGQVVNNVAPTQQEPQRNVSISITGDNFGAGGIRSLIDEINEAVGDGAVIRVGG